MTAGEAAYPRTFIKTAYKTIYYRFGLFFILGSLCVGIVVSFNDPTIQAILAGESSKKGGGSSHYVIAMKNLEIAVLPDIVNALLITSVFSAGNTLTYCATRSLYELALEGRAPKILSKTTAKGVPIYAFIVVLAFPFLSFLQLSNNSSEVLNWLFYRACKAQGIDRRSFPYFGYLQPYCAYIGVAAMIFVLLFYGYTAFDPWSVEKFFQNYTMQLVAPILYLGWKFVHGTKAISPSELDLVWERPLIDAYEASLPDNPPTFWQEMHEMIGIKRKGTKDSDA
ncbi:unnamed protein product [Penicillium pancosmium]